MIKTGDKIPSMKLMVATAEGPREADTAELLGRGKVVMFAVPGAFTPTCSAKHLPGFVKLAAEFKAKGVDKIVCMAVNDAYVMGAWAKDQKSGDAVVMLADGNGDFTAAVGLEMDGSGFGLGSRPQRYAMVIEDGVVTTLHVEPGAGLSVSSADAILEVL